MTKFADLHVHTYFSDGTYSPEQLVKAALKEGISCLGVTDHDTLEGVVPVQEAAKGHDLEIIGGIELSTEISGKDIHILGYFLDATEGPLVDNFRKAQQVRVERAEKMIGKLKEMGVADIDMDDVSKQTKTDSIGRPHVAKILKEKGCVSTIGEAFDKYIGEGCPAYVPKYKMTPIKAIELIRESSGVAVLAHPMVNNKDEIIPRLVKAGLQGIEVYYPNCCKEVIKYYEGIAQKHGLAVTGGSDSHGNVKSYTTLGKIKLPYEFVEKLKEVRDKSA